MRVILLCAGDATRWGDYLDTPKHLVPVFGERLLDRTVRILRQVQPSVEIVIVSKSSTVDDYTVDGAVTVVADLDRSRFDADKFMSSREWWSEDSDTILLYGDVFYTTKAIRKILNTPVDDWLLFARFGENPVTGSKWGECFAFKLAPSFHEEFWGVGEYLINLYRREEIWRIGGWEFYAMLAGGDLDNPGEQLANGVSITGWTEDFDYPADFSMWCERVVMALGKDGKLWKELA